MKKRPSKYTAELLAPVVAVSSSYAEVMRRLGLSETGGNHRMITAHIRNLEISTSHFKRRQHADIPRGILDPIVQNSRSIHEVLRKLGLSTQNGSLNTNIRRQIHELGISINHFRGQAWSRGQTADTHPTLRLASERMSFPAEQVFVEKSTYNTGGIVRRLLRMGWDYHCAECGINEWRGKTLRLHLDHLNGTHNDNRLENLRFLCPNCHSQTETYCGKNKRKAAARW